MFERAKYPLLIIILMLAFAGRVINSDSESLWVDEGFSYWAIRDGNDLFDVVLNDVHPPIYFVMLKGWSSVTGLSEFALRYLSLLPSLLAVAMVYQVAREILLQTNTRASLVVVPLLAALMFALADMENYIAQETRMYTWHVLWLTVSMWAFLRWLRTHKPTMQWLWFGASVLLLYTHYIGAAGIAVQGIFALIFLRGRKRTVALSTLVAIVVLFVPWLLVVVGNQTENVGTGFNVPSTLESLWQYRIEWFTQQWALNIGLALMGVWWLVNGYRRENFVSTDTYWGRMGIGDSWRYGVLLVLWVVVPVAGAYILNLFTPILIDYRLTQITPAVALLIAFGLGAFRGRTLLFLVMVILVYGIVIDDTPRPRPPWREVGMTATEYAQSGDLALAHVTPSGDWQVIYYYDRWMPEGVQNISLRQWQLERGFDDYNANLPVLLDAHDHVWLMHWSSDTSAFEILRETGHVQTALMQSDWLGNDLNTYRFDRVPAVDEAIATYESGMILRDSAIYPDSLQVDLWWSNETTLDADYTVSALLLDVDGRLVAQLDSFPFENQRPTTTWQANEVVYDPRRLVLADGIDALSGGTYTVAVKVYLWTPEGIIDQRTSAGEDFAVIGEIVVE